MPKLNDRGELRVYEARCEECLFSPHKIVSDERRKDILAACHRRGTWFTCHLSTLRGEGICCRGFYDASIGTYALLQIAGRLGVLQFLPLPEKEKR